MFSFVLLSFLFLILIFDSHFFHMTYRVVFSRYCLEKATLYENDKTVLSLRKTLIILFKIRIMFNLILFIKCFIFIIKVFIKIFYRFYIITKLIVVLVYVFETPQ